MIDHPLASDPMREHVERLEGEIVIKRTITRGPLTCRTGRWVKHNGVWYFVPRNRTS